MVLSKLAQEGDGCSCVQREEGEYAPSARRGVRHAYGARNFVARFEIPQVRSDCVFRASEEVHWERFERLNDVRRRRNDMKKMTWLGFGGVLVCGMLLASMGWAKQANGPKAEVKSGTGWISDEA